MNATVATAIAALAPRLSDWVRLAVKGGEALCRPGVFGAGIAMFWHLFARGGFVVRTPAAGRPMIATTVQPDGDLLAVIDCEVLKWSAARQIKLQTEHAARVRQSLDQLATLPELLRGALVLLWLPFVAQQGYTVVAIPIDAVLRGKGGFLAALLDAARQQVVPQLTAILFLLLRLLLPPIVRGGLRWQWRRESAAWLRAWQAKT